MSHTHHAERSAGSLARNIGFLFFSFVNTACITVFPQHFFAAPQYETRALWLSATLLAGALCSAAGVHLAGKHGLGRKPMLWGLSSCTVLVLLALVVAADAIVHPLLFLLSQCVLCLGTGYLSQCLDERSMSVSGVKGRIHNDSTITACRFLGMLGAPLLFSFALPGSAFAVAFVAAGALCGLLGTWRLTLAPPISVPSDKHGVPTTRASVRERALEGVAIVIYASYCVLASSAVLLLGDLQGFADALTRGPRLIAVVYASAFLGTVLVGTLGGRAQLGWMLPAPILLLLAAFYLMQDSGRAWSMQVAVCTALGFGFALLLLCYRNHVSGIALALGRPGLIEKFNRLPILAALLAFLVMVVGAGFARLAQVEFAYVVVALLVLASTGAIGTLYFLARLSGTASSGRMDSDPDTAQ